MQCRSRLSPNADLHSRSRVQDKPTSAHPEMTADCRSCHARTVSPIDIERWALSAENSRVGYHMSHVLPRFPIYTVHHGKFSRLTPTKPILHLFTQFYPTFAKIQALPFSYKTGNQVWGHNTQQQCCLISKPSFPRSFSPPLPLRSLGDSISTPWSWSRVSTSQTFNPSSTGRASSVAALPLPTSRRQRELVRVTITLLCETLTFYFRLR